MNKSDYKDMWVYIEHDGKKVADVGLELCCEVRKLCDVTGDRLMAVIIGKLPQAEVKKVIACGVDGVIRVNKDENVEYNTEVYTNVFTELTRKYLPSAVFVGGTENGRDFAPRYAVRVDTGCTSDAVELEIDKDTGDIRFIEPAVGGKIIAVITIPSRRPQVGTIRPGTFRYEPTGARGSAETINETIVTPKESIVSRLVSFRPNDDDPSLNIADSDVIVCVGNGLKSAEDLPKYRRLAELLGGKLGCTRPLVDRELLPYRLQIGQSGVMIKPKTYICFGVSGAVNHVTGVSADLFIAVNSDPQAQIFNFCDYGIVGDMDTVCNSMIEELDKRKAAAK
ncbi:MAG: electron transfer flavoprotein subunit alpha/FixB family protein [Oscillospiraceae bacterium]|nr:electron transfer flavoprotein subunit alpha/FixB family protein [Oscillospiraceae bacterium]